MLIYFAILFSLPKKPLVENIFYLLLDNMKNNLSFEDLYLLYYNLFVLLYFFIHNLDKLLYFLKFKFRFLLLHYLLEEAKIFLLNKFPKLGLYFSVEKLYLYLLMNLSKMNIK